MEGLFCKMEETQTYLNTDGEYLEGKKEIKISEAVLVNTNAIMLRSKRAPVPVAYGKNKHLFDSLMCLQGGSACVAGLHI